LADWFQTVVDVEVGADDAGPLAEQVLGWLIERGVVEAAVTDCTFAGPGHAPGPSYTSIVEHAEPGLLSLRTNGMAVITSRIVASSGDGEWRMHCRWCGQSVDLEQSAGARDEVFAAIDAWHAGGPSQLRCRGCGRDAALNDWLWTPGWAFGNLAFEFWNWPLLNTSFIDELGARLGHRVVVTRGKL
jgi:hypothetical protein